VKYQARDVTGKCEHTRPILIPCDACVDKRLAQVVAHENRDMKEVVRTSIESISLQEKSSREWADRILAQHEKAVREKAKLAEELDVAKRCIVALQRDLSDIGAQLVAERRAQIIVHQPVEEDEAV